MSKPQRLNPLLVALVAVVVGVMMHAPEARAQRSKVPAATPAIYVAHLNGMTGWDLTPELLNAVCGDADLTFGDLTRISNPGPDQSDYIVDDEAWANHIIVLRLDLTHDSRATNLDARKYAAKFQLVLKEQTELRNRRIVLWIRRADDVAAFMIPMVEEVFLAPGATSTITSTFAERFSRGDESAVPKAPSLDEYQVCANHAELLDALSLPEGTNVLFGNAQRNIDRWADHRDAAIEKAEQALGEQWDQFLETKDDPDAPAYLKINSHREMDEALRYAHARLVHDNDLRRHPVFVPLEKKVLQRIKTLSKMPMPKADR